MKRRLVAIHRSRVFFQTVPYIDRCNSRIQQSRQAGLRLTASLVQARTFGTKPSGEDIVGSLLGSATESVR
jgi:hypothetical protein